MLYPLSYEGATTYATTCLRLLRCTRASPAVLSDSAPSAEHTGSTPTPAHKIH